MPTEIPNTLVKKTHGRVMHFFKDKICAIPHGTGNERQIADYLVDFARELGLECKRSGMVVNGKQTHNVAIYKPATVGYEGLDTVILQSHIDMVCQKTKESAHDFSRDPIEVIDDGKFLRANGTTLGADNGIGAACILAILESADIAHPPIEALFTSDEEDGMGGAIAVCEEKFISGRRLINIDTDTEGTLFCGCAGGINANFKIPVKYEPVKDGFSFVNVELTGLMGGHSGTEIIKGRANAHKLMARALYAVNTAYPLALVAFTGGDKRNVITREASAVVAVQCEYADDVVKLVDGFTRVFQPEYDGIETGGLKLEAKIIADAADIKTNISANINKNINAGTALTQESIENFLRALINIPNGVLAMHGSIDNLVETSCNLGIVRQEADHFYLCSLIRSFSRKEKLKVLEQMRRVAGIFGAGFSSDSDYPNWKPNPKSDLAARFARAYESAFPGSKAIGLPRMESIHAGLECGYFAENFPGTDLIACGATITGAHTTEERVDIGSVERLVRLLITVLGQMN